MSKSRVKHRFKSHFFNLPFIIFALAVLIFSNIFVIQDNRWASTITITVFVFIADTLLGYYTVKALLLIKYHRIYKFQVIFLLSLSYVIVPLIATYLGIAFNDWLWVINNDFFVLFSKIFGITLFANTFLLFFYYTNTSVIIFEDLKIAKASIELQESQKIKDNNTSIKKEKYIGEKSTDNINSLDDSFSEPKNSQETREYLLLKSNRVLTRIRFDEIVYLEVNLNTVLIQTVKRFYETRSTLGEILQGLPSNFIQISKSIVINLNFFEQLIFESETRRSKAKVTYKGNEEDMEESFYIGRKFLAQFKEKLVK